MGAIVTAQSSDDSIKHFKTGCPIRTPFLSNVFKGHQKYSVYNLLKNATFTMCQVLG